MQLSQSHLEYPITNNDWSLDISKLLRWLKKVNQKLQSDKKFTKKYPIESYDSIKNEIEVSIEQISNKIGQEKGSTTHHVQQRISFLIFT